jgi:hypothetical protein
MVQDIVIDFVYKRHSVEKLLLHYPRLNRAQIHAALAYYYEYIDAINQQIEFDEAYVRQAKEQGLGQRNLPVLR